MNDDQNPVSPQGAPAAPQINPAAPAPVSYVDDYQPPSVAPAPQPVSFDPPAAMPTMPAAPVAPTPMPAINQPDSQSLEDQNIFNLLGVEDSSEEEKESFLDELQQVIWEDFLENDVQLLVTETELSGLKAIQAKTDLSEEDKQEEMVVYLEKLIPDLEEIMLEKALELKEDMVKERVAGMREYFAEKPDELKKLDEADKLIQDNQWRDAAGLLNSLTA